MIAVKRRLHRADEDCSPYTSAINPPHTPAHQPLSPRRNTPAPSRPLTMDNTQTSQWLHQPAGLAFSTPPAPALASAVLSIGPILARQQLEQMTTNPNLISPSPTHADSPVTKVRTKACCSSVSGERRWLSRRVSNDRCTLASASSALMLQWEHADINNGGHELTLMHSRPPICLRAGRHVDEHVTWHRLGNGKHTSARLVILEQGFTNVSD